MIPSNCLNSLAGDIYRDQDSLSLQPFRSQTILVIGPFPFRNDAPGSWLEKDRSKSELIEGEDSTPFRRMPESGNCVRQHRKDTNPPQCL